MADKPNRFFRLWHPRDYGWRMSIPSDRFEAISPDHEREFITMSLVFDFPVPIYPVWVVDIYPDIVGSGQPISFPGW